LLALTRRQPRDWARIETALGCTMAAEQSQLRMMQWSPEQREHARLRAKERVAAAKKLAVSTKNWSARYSEIERHEAIARERADQQVVCSVRWDAYGREA
jgi:hypothetical protein